MRRWLIRNVTLPLWEKAAGRERLTALDELQATQFWPRARLENLQAARLRALVLHAYENVPYYRQVFDARGLKPDEIQGPGDLEKLPILTKDLIAENFSRLQARNIARFRHRPYATGGTSGRHLHFLNTQKTFDYHMAATFRGWRWMGWDFGEKYAHIWGASRDIREELKPKARLRQALTDRRILIQALMFTEESLTRDLERLVKFQPRFIMSYPSALMIVVRAMKRRRLRLKLDGVSTTSETLYSWQRETIETFFGCPVTDDYGGRESSIKAIQCERGRYHIAIENGVLETVRGTRPVSGEMGKVLLTEFHNFAMPLIRYENTDVATLSGASCSCGRSLPLLDGIQGRVSDIFVTRDGRLIPAQFFMVVLIDLPGESYQVIQETTDEILIKIVKGRDFDERKLESVRRELRRWLGDETRIEVDTVTEIPLTASGKRRYFFSKVNPDLDDPSKKREDAP
jgi:phenylacetate-CoA ligase